MKNAIIQTPRKLYWIYITGFLAILTLPLLNLPPWFSPPDWGKTMVFQPIFAILLFLFISQILLTQNFSLSRIKQAVLRKPNKENLHLYLLGVLLGIFSLATLFSLEPLFSFWGDPIRAGGFINFAFYILLAFLLFLIVKPKDWTRIWDFTIGIGILVALVGLFQYLHLFSTIFISRSTEIPSTVGGPSFLGIFLLLLSFLALSFGIQEQRKAKRIFYFLAFAFFVFILILAASQAAYVGFALGLLYFFFFYPRKMKKLRMVGILLFITVILLSLLLNTFIDSSLKQNYIVNNFLSWRVDESRIAAWTVATQAFQDRPLLGYGPGNFSIGFDKYYDPALPGIQRVPTGAITTWWDRAHNIFFDIALQAGIFALLAYLAFFATLFWKLQQAKKRNVNKTVIAHGIQASFLGYFAANFFSFDGFSTYLIAFLLVGYSFFMIRQHINQEETAAEPSQLRVKISKPKIATVGILFIVLVLFIWNFTIRPFWVNTQINIAEIFVENQNCTGAFRIMDSTRDVQRTFLDAYVIFSYIDFLRKCNQAMPEQRIALAQKGYELLKENTALRPTYTRNWIFLGGFTNTLVDAAQSGLLPDVSPQRLEELKQETHTYFETALRLSPKRQDTHVEWIKSDFISKDYARAKQKSQECINLDPSFGTCWWLLARAELSLGNSEAGQAALKEAEARRYSLTSEDSLLQLTKAYIVSKDYKRLAETYEELTKKRGDYPQYYASLAAAYKELGEYEKAREAASKVLRLDNNLKEEVDAFLRELP